MIRLNNSNMTRVSSRCRCSCVVGAALTLLLLSGCETLHQAAYVVKENPDLLPTAVDVARNISNAAQERNEWKNASERFKQAVALIKLGDQAMDRRDRTGAYRLYRRAHEVLPTQKEYSSGSGLVQYYRNLALEGAWFSAWLAEDYASAADIARVAATWHDWSPDEAHEKAVLYMHRLADALAEGGKPDEAISVLRQIASRYPAETGHAFSKIGRIYADVKGDHAAAVTVLETALHHQPTDAVAWRTMVTSLFALGRRDDARARIQGMIPRLHHLNEAFMGRSPKIDAELAKSARLSVRSLARRCLQPDADSPDLALALCNHLVSQEDGERLFNDIVMRIRAYSALRRFGDAMVDINRLQTMATEQADLDFVTLLRITCHLQMGERTAARRVADERPAILENAEPWLLCELGYPDRAIELVVNAVARAEEPMDALCFRAAQYLNIFRELSVAHQDLDRLDREDAGNKMLLFRIWMRGRLLLHSGEPQRALAIIEDGVRAFPQHPGLREELGYVFLALRRHQLAVEEFAEAIRRNPRSRSAHQGRVDALLLSGRANDAAEACDQALSADPYDASAYVARALAHHREGRTDFAWRDLRKARELGFDPLIWMESPYAKPGAAAQEKLSGFVREGNWRAALALLEAERTAHSGQPGHKLAMGYVLGLHSPLRDPARAALLLRECLATAAADAVELQVQKNALFLLHELEEHGTLPAHRMNWLQVAQRARSAYKEAPLPVVSTNAPAGHGDGDIFDVLGLSGAASTPDPKTSATPAPASTGDVFDALGF